MHEIKFRAWDKEDKKMVIPDTLWHGKDGVMEVIVEDEEGKKWDIGCHCHDNILMQFTGLQDKEGMDIYEGDIVRFGGSSIHGKPFENVTEVTYSDHDAGFDPIMWWSFNGLSGEVIGNIYENPELIK